MRGDPLPSKLAEYYKARDAGDMDTAAACFAADGVYAVPPATGSETDARDEVHGRDALLQRFRADGLLPFEHETTCAVVEGDVCLLEGVLHARGNRDANEPIITFVASAQMDADGSIGRYVVFASGPVVPQHTGARSTGDVDARALVDRYFHLLEDAQMEEAAACFSDDVVYSHPPYRNTGITDPNRVTFRGNAELVAGFTKRGRTSIQHEILTFGQRGADGLFEGVVGNVPDGATVGFVSSYTLDDQGRIARYLSYMCVPAVPRR